MEMEDDVRILAVIPARGGSKGIPRKNVRLLNGKPLLSYAIETARACPQITDIVVTSDDDEILLLAERYGAIPLTRESTLARDATTLDPVVYDALLRMEEQTGQRYEVVLTLQPTSPLLRVQTLQAAIQAFLVAAEAGETDTLISGVNRPHLAWTRQEAGYVPLYEKRLNRQQLPPHYLETGAFVLSLRAQVTEATRFGSKIRIYEMPEEEAVDIDTPEDWLLCAQRLAKKRIVLRTNGYREIGMGHIYRCLTLAYALMEHEVLLVTDVAHTEGARKLADSFLPFETVTDDADFFRLLERVKPDVVVNDCLDTTATYIKELKRRSPRVVTFEDLGEGAYEADAVVNALYTAEGAPPHWFCGSRYICLRDEFLAEPPESSQSGRESHTKQRLRVLVLFGGTDPSGLTKRLYTLAQTICEEQGDAAPQFTVLAGPAYDCEANEVFTDTARGIVVIRDAKRVSDYMRKADLAVTSQGRTVYELAAVGVPAIVLAQNAREQRHTFAQMENGFLNLGLGVAVSEETIRTTLDWLLRTPEIRAEMRTLMRRHELKDGIRRVKEILIGTDMPVRAPEE